MEALIKAMPTQVLEQAQQTAAKTDSSIGSQMGIVMTKQLYRELGVNTDRIERNYILVTGLKMLLMTLGMVLCVIGVTFCSARFAAGICRDMRHDVFQKSPRSPMGSLTNSQPPLSSHGRQMISRKSSSFSSWCRARFCMHDHRVAAW